MLSLEESPKITITHFVTDKLKQGGHYEQAKGQIRKIDKCNSTIIMTNGTIIQMLDIYTVSDDSIGSIFDLS